MTSSLRFSVLLFCFVAFKAEARVFTFDDQTVATYLRGTGGFTNLQETGFAPGFPSSTSFSSSANIRNAYSGEIGVAFTSPRRYTTRLGVEVLYPYSSGVTGSNSSGAPLVNLTNQLYSIIPQINVEIFTKQGTMGRFYVGGGAGYAITILSNSAALTTLGQSTYGISNYSETATGTSVMGQAFLGFEFPAFDNVSLSFDAGYRYLYVNNYTANGGYQSPLGTFATGAAIKNADGTNRATDLSGIFAAVNLRFYIFR